MLAAMTLIYYWYKEMNTLSYKKPDFNKKDFDYEEDDYDRLKRFSRSNNPYRGFTNKATKKKPEFDYEEDAYEPEKNT
jgi:hypothetical protein